MALTVEQFVEKFQCPGCVCGSDTQCDSYIPNTDGYGIHCNSHVCGTMIGFGNVVALGLPIGFCKPGFDFHADPPRSHNRMSIRLWRDGDDPGWDKLNVPVWAMVEDGFLFVRTFAPRINRTWVDVVEGGTLALCPGALDVAEFINEID